MQGLVTSSRQSYNSAGGNHVENSASVLDARAMQQITIIVCLQIWTNRTIVEVCRKDMLNKQVLNDLQNQEILKTEQVVCCLDVPS